jgi:hypothetical protein
VSEVITGDELFADLTKRIKNVASKMDIILFSVPQTKDQRNELVEDVLTLQCFHIAAYRQPSVVFERFFDRLAQEQTSEQKKRKKDTASFFTPPFIAEYIVQTTLDPLVDKLFKGRKPTKPETKIKRILRLRICDPAVGGGIFLVCAHDYLMTKILEAKPDADLDEMSRKSAKCLFGVDINPDAIEGCKLALHLNIAKWALKNKINEFVNTANQNLPSPNDSSGSSEKPCTAQEPAQEKTNTEKTTQTSAAKRVVRPAVTSSAWRIGIAAKGSARQSVQLERALETQTALIKKLKKNSSVWSKTKNTRSGLNQKLRATARSMASIGAICFRSFCFRLLKAKPLNSNTSSMAPSAANTSAASLVVITRSKSLAATKYFRQFATIAVRCLSTNLRNTWRTSGESRQTMSINSRACFFWASTKGRFLIMSAERTVAKLRLFGSVWVFRDALKTSEASA